MNTCEKNEKIESANGNQLKGSEAARFFELRGMYRRNMLNGGQQLVWHALNSAREANGLQPIQS